MLHFRKCGRYRRGKEATVVYKIESVDDYEASHLPADLLPEVVSLISYTHREGDTIENGILIPSPNVIICAYNHFPDIRTIIFL